MKRINYFPIILLSIILLNACRSSRIENPEKTIHDTKTGEVRKGAQVFYYMYRANAGVRGWSDYSVKNLSKKEIFYVKSEYYTTSTIPVPVGQNDPNGVSYFKIIFFNNNKTAEIPATTNGDLARSFLRDGLIANGDLDTAAQSRYILIHGNEFSKRANAINGKTIIINGNQIPTQGNGVDIKIGY